MTCQTAAGEKRIHLKPGSDNSFRVTEQSDISLHIMNRARVFKENLRVHKVDKRTYFHAMV